MSKFKALNNIHSHSHLSLDGAATVQQIVDRNIELGATAVTLTEHGNLNSAIELYHTCKKTKKILPVLGIELYIESPFKDELEKRYRKEMNLASLTGKDLEKAETKLEKKLREAYVHLTVHFKDEWAYTYFCKLSPVMEERAVVRWGERKALCTWDELKKASGHITICSSCIVGAITKWTLPYKDKDGLVTNNPELAEKMYCEVREIAGKDNFFVEIFPHKVDKNWQKPVIEDGKIIKEGFFEPHECNPVTPDGDIQKVANKFVLEMAKKYGDKPLISLDSHFAWERQRVVQEARLGNGQENWKFSNSYHILSTEEAAASLKSSLAVTDRDIEEWVDNSYAWASLFKDFKLATNEDRWVLESLPDNWMQQLKQKIDYYGRMDWSNQVMLERLKKEINILGHNGRINLISYVNTVEGISRYCKENDVLMSLRGSAGGSFLLYLLGVTFVNPLNHDLSFERFITDGRIRANTMPDADLDLSNRDKVIKHLESIYGDRICRISIDTSLRLKSSIKDAERAIKGSISKATEDLCKTLPAAPQGTTDKDFVFGYADDGGVHHDGLFDVHGALKEWAAKNREIWESVTEMMGIYRNKSTHPCAIVIADKPVQEYCPVIRVGKALVTGYSPKSVEMAGLIKYDLLGLNTLRDIQDCLISIKARLGITLDIGNLPYCKKSYDNFGYGQTETVFQFDTDTVRPGLKSIKPSSLDGLAAVTSLYRPGAMDAPSGDGRTMSEVFVARANGEPVEYIHPELEPILKETYAVILYQEQALRIFRDIGGFSHEEAEVARRGIGKKDEKLLAGITANLKTRILKKGDWSEEQIDLLISQIMASSRYSFNKSHAISYAYIAYACMYLKTNYPLDWWKATLSNAHKDEVPVKFWRYVHDFTKLPDINNSSDTYEILPDNMLQSPIAIIKGIGEKAYIQLTKNAPYTSLKQFIEIHIDKRTDGSRSAVHSGIIHKLVAGGVLDSLFDKDLSVEEKLHKFELVKAEVREEKVKPIPEEFVGITEFGRYMIKKQLISVYSQDLRPLLLPNRGGQKVIMAGREIWRLQDKTICLDGEELSIIKAKSLNGELEPYKWYSAIGYVIDEQAKDYMNKTKRRTVLNVDVNGLFYEDVLWPDFDGDGIAPVGFEGMPVILMYQSYYSRNKGEHTFSLRKVVPLIQKNDLEKYNLV